MISCATECPSCRALRFAISAEMATSPASSLRIPGIGGNDSTSVALFLLRKRSFKACSSRLVVTSTSTAPFTPAAWQARLTNLSSAASLSPATRFRKMINDSLCALSSQLTLPKQTGGSALGALLLNLTRFYCLLSSSADGMALLVSGPFSAAALPFVLDSDSGRAIRSSATRVLCSS